MGRQTETRDEKNTAKYLYRVWTRVDNKISLPLTLTGDALLPKLDGIAHPAPVSRKIRFSPRVFTWQSGVTYAAAFVLIVALSTILTRGDQQKDILTGQISLSSSGSGEPVETVEEQAVAYDVPVETHAGADTPQKETAPDVQAFAAEVAEEPDAGTVASEARDAEGIGGSGESIALGQDELYTYTYRPNDPNDPAKQGFPIAVSIMNTETGELACELDVSDMSSVEEYYTNGDVLALVGNGGEDVLIRVYSIASMSEPVMLLDCVQQGAFVDARLYNNTVHILTLANSSEGLTCEIVELPDALSESCVVVSAIDLVEGAVFQKAFSGADGEMTLFNLHAYVNYTGEPSEGNETGNNVAQIQLDGMEIELSDSPEPPQQ